MSICRDPRSGQLRDLFIRSRWGNMKMFPVSHKLTENTNAFGIMTNNPICDDPGALVLGVTGRSSEVI